MPKLMQAPSTRKGGFGMMLLVLLERRLVALHQEISRSHLIVAQVWVLLDTLVGKGGRMEITCQMGMGDGWRESQRRNIAGNAS